MDKVTEMQDSVATNGTVEATNIPQKMAQISSKSGDRDTGFRTQAQLEAEVEELDGRVNELLDELKGAAEEFQQERATYEQQLEECRQNITNYDAQLRQTEKEHYEALRESMRYRQAFAAAQQRSQVAQESV